MQLFYEPQANTSEFVLNSEEARHCIKVLRKRVGDSVSIIDGKGTFYKCKILNDNIKCCNLLVIDTSYEIRFEGHRHIAIAPTKNQDRIEWFVEKAVEIGIDEISFILCKNSERRSLNLDRVIKKGVSAMKQSLKATLPIFNELISYYDFIQSQTEVSKYIAYVDFENEEYFPAVVHKREQNLILIGPEGDFTTDELSSALSQGFKMVSLGQSRLRTETAGIVACTFLNS